MPVDVQQVEQPSLPVPTQPQPAPSFPCNMTRTQHERYTKAELLGQGACKKVFKAFDEAEGIEVAWNEVHVTDINFACAKAQQETRDRVFSEIMLLKQLKHKNILAMHDWWLDTKNSVLIFITELFMDGSLRTYRRKHRNVDITVLKRWAWQILQGLVYLHGHNPPIIHRDLKSDNIFINGTSGKIKIGDLGFATFLAGFSAAMSVIGTPEFMAPELYEEQYTEKVDVYSFGMCIMELATLEYPYNECRNPAQIFKKVTQGIPPQGIEKIQDRELREFVELCIRHDPRYRPEARQLLKHPFFDAIRDPASVRKNLTGIQLANSSFLPSPSQASTPTQQQQQQQQQQGQQEQQQQLLAQQQAQAQRAAQQEEQQRRQQHQPPHKQNGPILQRPSPFSNQQQAPQPDRQNSTHSTHAQQPYVLLPPPQQQQQQGPLYARGSPPSPTTNGYTSAPPSAQPTATQQPPPAQLSPLHSYSSCPESSGALEMDEGDVVFGDSKQSSGTHGHARNSGRPRRGGHRPHHPHRPHLPPVAPSNAHSTQSMHSSLQQLPGIQEGGTPPMQAPFTGGGRPQHISPHGGGSRGSTQGSRSPGTERAPSLVYRNGVYMPRFSSTEVEEPEDGKDVCSECSGSEGYSEEEGDEPFGEGSEDGQPHQLGSYASQCGSCTSNSSPVKGPLRRVSSGIGTVSGQGVRLTCHTHQEDENTLAFSMSFVNHRGTRKKVGFAYDMLADTATDVANEMVDNLSLDCSEADYIAALIQDEISKCQSHTGSRRASGAQYLPYQEQQGGQEGQSQEEGVQQQQQQQLQQPQPQQQLEPQEGQQGQQGQHHPAPGANPPSQRPVHVPRSSALTHELHHHQHLGRSPPQQPQLQEQQQQGQQQQQQQQQCSPSVMGKAGSDGVAGLRQPMQA